MGVTTVVLVLLAALAAPAGATEEASDAQPTVAAEWREHEMIFHYQDFTTHFSCLGLERKVEQILEELGVRDDAKVSMYGCSASIAQAAPANSLKLRFATLHPVAEGSDAEPVAAQWGEADLRRGRQRYLDRGDCALVERIRDQVLPLFAHEIIEDRTRCIPHRIDGRGPSLRVKVLRPVS